MHRLQKITRLTPPLLNFKKSLLPTLITCQSDVRFNQQQAVKAFSEIPGPLRLPLVKNLYLIPSMIRDIEKSHEINAAKFDKYGPIYRENLMMEMVHVSRAEDVEMVMRNEGKYPHRLNMELWLRWKEENNLSKGLLLEEGEQWKRLRSQLDKRMLRRDFVATYLDDFKHISEQLVAKIHHSNHANQPYLPDIEDTLFHWAIESSGLVVLETHLGGSESNKEATELVKAVQNIFICTNRLFYNPAWFNKLFLPKWHKLFCDSWDTVAKTTENIVGAKLKSLAESDAAKGNGGGDGKDYGFLRHMLSTDLKKEEIFGSINEIILGAVETTSTTMLWLIHELVQQPSIQEHLHQQISQLPNGEPQCLDDLEKVPLVKAVVKETLRLHPVIPLLPRVIVEDVILSNHHVPKGTVVLSNLYRIGRSSEYFSEPSAFKPERWLRGEGGQGASHKFAWTPFGFGPRSCIGRRIAELEMHLLVCMLLSKFKMTSADSSPVHSINKSFPCPSRPLKILFTPRN